MSVNLRICPQITVYIYQFHTHLYITSNQLHVLNLQLVLNTAMITRLHYPRLFSPDKNHVMLILYCSARKDILFVRSFIFKGMQLASYTDIECRWD